MDFTTLASEQADADRVRDERRKLATSARDDFERYSEAWGRLAGLFENEAVVGAAGVPFSTPREPTKRDLSKAEADFRVVVKHLAGVGLMEYLPGVTERVGSFDPAYRLAESAVCEALRLAADGKPTKGAIADGLASLPATLTTNWHVAAENVRFALNAAADNVEPTKLITPEARPQGAAARNTVLLDWYNATGEKTHHSPRAILDKWNGLSAEERKGISPGAPGRMTAHALKQVLRRAKEVTKPNRPTKKIAKKR